MTRLRLFLLGVVWLGLLGFAGHQWHVYTRDRTALGAASAELDRLRAEADTLRREKTRADSELAQAEHQLNAVTPPRLTASAATEQTEIATWLENVKRLRRLFAERPEHAIPEMRLLTDDDWLRVGKSVKFDTEKNTREALAAVRAASIQRFVGQLTPAVTAYSKAFPNEKPASIRLLAAFFKSPTDVDLLDRYELQDPYRPEGRGPSTWYVQNRTPVDVVYDSRFRIGASSQFQSPGADAWIPDYHERSRRASDDYAKANAGQRPARRVDVIPYFNPPLAPDVAAALKQADADR